MTNTEAIKMLRTIKRTVSLGNRKFYDALDMAIEALEAQNGDAISRKAAIDAIVTWTVEDRPDVEMPTDLIDRINELPSVQSERTCVNCGRTANNGGWYADGRTRCPIEEHYALPKDGFCHLWEKRNVTDDDYPERMEE